MSKSFYKIAEKLGKVESFHVTSATFITVESSIEVTLATRLDAAY